MNVMGLVLLVGLDRTIDKGRHLVDESGIKDTRLYKATAVTGNDAVNVVNGWIDKQAARTLESRSCRLYRRNLCYRTQNKTPSCR